MYKLMASISVLVRLLYLPNPFEPLPNAEFVNLIAGGVIHAITYATVGIFYERGSAPAWGSFLYLVFYGIHTGLIMLMGYFQWATVANVIIIVTYLIILGTISKAINSVRFY